MLKKYLERIAVWVACLALLATPLVGCGSLSSSGSISGSSVERSTGSGSASGSSSESAPESASGTSSSSGKGINSSDPQEVLSNIPAYTGNSYTVLNDAPNFTDKELASDDFIKLSELDSLGRCGVAFGVICEHTMPDQDSESRGDIHEIHPSGWKQAKYESIKDDRDSDGHLYERSHLLGWALSGLNAEPRNLITGTHYFNGTGMLEFENKIARYVERKGGRVLYRVTPLFAGNNLVATGVRMEAYSLDDDGDSVCFDVFVYNVQPGIDIDYATGESAEGQELL